MKYAIIVILLCFCIGHMVYAEEIETTDGPHYTIQVNPNQYVCKEHGFVETEIITYNGMEFQLCRVCIDEFIENNSDSIANFMERAWRGK